MARTNTSPQRLPQSYIEDMKRVAKIRLDKGLAKFNPQSLGIAEMTRLLRRTQGYQLSLNELKVKPKKENLI